MVDNQNSIYNITAMMNVVEKILLIIDFTRIFVNGVEKAARTWSHTGIRILECMPQFRLLNTVFSSFHYLLNDRQHDLWWRCCMPAVPCGEAGVCMVLGQISTRYVRGVFLGKERLSLSWCRRRRVPRNNYNINNNNNKDHKYEMYSFDLIANYVI